MSDTENKTWLDTIGLKKIMIDDVEHMQISWRPEGTDNILYERIPIQVWDYIIASQTKDALDNQTRKLFFRWSI